MFVCLFVGGETTHLSKHTKKPMAMAIAIAIAHQAQALVPRHKFI